MLAILLGRLVIAGVTNIEYDVLKIVVLEGIQEIPSATFCDFSNLVLLTVPTSVEIIQGEAFDGTQNKKLSCIRFVGGVENSQLTTIGPKAFYHCGSLLSFVVPPKVCIIGNSSFAHCHSLVQL